uniref:DH domain-containing protein n=1 Tax=Magallana gigas TaxID=29159 RepID=A0A8W8L680_MAGGI
MPLDVCVIVVDPALCFCRGFPPARTSHRPWRRYQDDDEDIYGNLPDLALHHDLDDYEGIYDDVYLEDDDELFEESSFNKPLKDILSKDDRDVIFAHIEKLLEIHEKFQAELQSACTSGKPKIGEVFVKYKKSLLLYGNYCSDMPKAQERLEEVCEMRAIDGKSKLKDLLEIPMKRFLNYPLSLRALFEQSGKQAEDKDKLEQGLEAMMPANTTLKDYGRLQKDGELNVKNHTDNKIRTR